jgi:hypothetical protein
MSCAIFPSMLAEVAAGYGLRALEAWGRTATLGARWSLTFVPGQLESRYCQRRAHSFTAFLNLDRRASAPHVH